MLRRVAVVVAAVRGGGHQVVQHGEAGLAGEHVVVVLVLVLVLASVPRRRRRRRGGSSSSLLHQGSSRGRDAAVGVVVLPAAREVGRQERAAGHDPVGVVARDVEVGDGVEAAELDGRDVVRLRRLLLRAEGAEVEVLVAGDAADARLPPPVLVVPAFIQSVIVTCIARSHSVVVVSDLVTPRYMDAPREKPLLFLPYVYVPY